MVIDAAMRVIMREFAPPFKQDGSWLVDSAGNHVADFVGDTCCYSGCKRTMSDDLNDAFGALVAEALNDYWRKHNA